MVLCLQLWKLASVSVELKVGTTRLPRIDSAWQGRSRRQWPLQATGGRTNSGVGLAKPLSIKALFKQFEAGPELQQFHMPRSYASVDARGRL